MCQDERRKKEIRSSPHEVQRDTGLVEKFLFYPQFNDELLLSFLKFNSRLVATSTGAGLPIGGPSGRRVATLPLLMYFSIHQLKHAHTTPTRFTSVLNSQLPWPFLSGYIHFQFVIFFPIHCNSLKFFAILCNSLQFFVILSNF